MKRSYIIYTVSVVFCLYLLLPYFGYADTADTLMAIEQAINEDLHSKITTWNIWLQQSLSLSEPNWSLAPAELIGLSIWGKGRFYHYFRDPDTIEVTSVWDDTLKMWNSESEVSFKPVVQSRGAPWVWIKFRNHPHVTLWVDEGQAKIWSKYAYLLMPTFWLINNENLILHPLNPNLFGQKLALPDKKDIPKNQNVYIIPLKATNLKLFYQEEILTTNASKWPVISILVGILLISLSILTGILRQKSSSTSSENQSKLDLKIPQPTAQIDSSKAFTPTPVQNNPHPLPADSIQGSQKDSSIKNDSLNIECGDDTHNDQQPDLLTLNQTIHSLSQELDQLKEALNLTNDAQSQSNHSSDWDFLLARSNPSSGQKIEPTFVPNFKRKNQGQSYDN